MKSVPMGGQLKNRKLFAFSLPSVQSRFANAEGKMSMPCGMPGLAEESTLTNQQERKKIHTCGRFIYQTESSAFKSYRAYHKYPFVGRCPSALHDVLPSGTVTALLSGFPRKEQETTSSI